MGRALLLPHEIDAWMGTKHGYSLGTLPHEDVVTFAGV